MASPKIFARRMATIANNIPTNANKVKQKLALVIDQTLVLTTPVDTGRARSNWIVQNSTPSRKEIPAAKKAAPLQQGRAEIAKARPDEPIWISNNLPYIQGLNEGNSVQAPAGFVEKAIQEATNAIAGVSLLKSELRITDI